ncbi:MAG: hypothetical protein K2P93_00785 [Alphaproteobacteria bacterium]|nr:hypothetical protein [Alphaproteobacteria bacterium]
MNTFLSYLYFTSAFCLVTSDALYGEAPKSLCPAISTISEVNSIVNNNNSKISPTILYQNKWVVPLYNGNSTDEKYPLFIPLNLPLYPEITVTQSGSQSLEGKFCFYEISFKPQPALSNAPTYLVGRFTLKNVLMPVTPPQSK